MLFRAHVLDTFFYLAFSIDYANLAVRNYEMQAENHYSYLITVKSLTPSWSLKHSNANLEM